MTDRTRIPQLTDSQEELLQQEWGGLCYPAAMQWIRDAKDSDWVVVHGTVLSDGRRIEHAWCERGDSVVDLTLPVGLRIVERQQYYRVIKPEVSKMYSSNDALMLLLTSKHQGPWDE